MFSKIFLEHFKNPKNVGELENPDGISKTEFQGEGCLDRITFYIKVEKDKIKDAKYRVRACSGTIASTSFLSEKIKNKPLKEALKLTSENIIEELRLPKRKHHSADLAIEALRRAIEDFKKRD
ncbi:MAG: iron-sulfur cluster assembly scaffold protein [Candidatus Methanofastidiosia archaeon]